MACFLVTHHVGADFSAEEWLAREKKIIGRLPREIKWVMSWYLPAPRQMVAHWDAPTEQAVRVALERSGLCESMPILKIETAVELYPKRYVARRNAAHAHKPHAQHGKAPTEHPKRGPHVRHEMSGVYAESVSSALQARAAAHLKPPPPG